MITYKQMPSYVQVILDGKIVGKIKAYKSDGYRYYPNGTKHAGPVHKTVEAVKKALESHE